MQLKIGHPENFWSGIMFIGFGVLAIYVSLDYPMGSAMRMGPGYFPTWLGGLMILFGALILATSFKLQGEKIRGFAWRQLGFLAAGFACFAFFIDRIGFILSLLMLVVLSAAAGRTFKLTEVLIMAAVLITGCIGLFVYALGLPFPLWWR